MNNKIPCGGFYLSDTLGVDENGKLGVNGGEPYKSLVTDGSGSVKWEDRLAYGRYRIRVPKPTSRKTSWYKVSDDFLTGSYDIGTRFYIIDSDEDNYEHTIMVSNGEVIADDIVEPYVIVALHDNVTFLSEDGWSITLPEKGTYFASHYSDYFITGAVLGDSNEPEITWDGSNFVGKKIEQAYIPKQTVYLELKYSRDYNNKEYYSIDMTLDEVLECIENGINVVLVYGNGHLYLRNINQYEATFVTPVFDSNEFTKFTITAKTSEAPIRQQTFDLILPSATSGSSKKFKITVDDSGTITATEI